MGREVGETDVDLLQLCREEGWWERVGSKTKRCNDFDRLDTSSSSDVEMCRQRCPRKGVSALRDLPSYEAERHWKTHNDNKALGGCY